MRRLGGVWPSVLEFDNLLQAYRKARRGKGKSIEVQRFALDLERQLLRLQAELTNGIYCPGAYRLFYLYERKPRLIAAAPFRDRVVHHALMLVIEAPLDRRFIHDSYACRKGKGVHAAVARYQGWAKRYPYVLKLDIARYFPSVDHHRLKEKLNRCIKDREVLQLLERIIDTAMPSEEPLQWFDGDDLLTPLERSRGLPIGNLTSQFLANLYLDDLDHFVKERLKVRAYLRYVDDLVLLGDSLGELNAWRSAITDHLVRDRLRLHDNKARNYRTEEGIDLLGYRVWPHRRELRNDNGHRMARRLRRFARAYAAGRMVWPAIDASVQAWIGHALHADTLGLRRTILGAVAFVRQ